MNLPRVSRIFVSLIFLNSSMFCLAEDQPTESAGLPDIGRIFANQGMGSPVALLLQADVAERDGNHQQALKHYRDLIELWPPESKWGSLANLRMARCLLCKRPAEPAAAKEVLEKIPSSTKGPALRRESQLWQTVVELHDLADGYLQGGPKELNRHLAVSLADWNVPAKLQEDFSEAIVSLSDRFLLAGKLDSGCALLRQAFVHTANEDLQSLILRKLITMQLRANLAADALLSARAYWLISVEEPKMLPDAVQQTINCMKALGASNAELERYRLLQMYGEETQSDDTVGKNPLEDLLARYTAGSVLIPESAIERQKTLAGKARLYLLNGDIVHAVPLIRTTVETSGGDTQMKEAGIRLARLALALHDGHIHGIERYERYLYQQSSNRAGSQDATDPGINPLEELIKGPENHEQQIEQ